MSPSASGSWEGKGTVLCWAVTLCSSCTSRQGLWNVPCSATALVVEPENSCWKNLCRGRWFLLPGQGSPALLFTNPDVPWTWSTRCSLSLDPGSRVAVCGSVSKANWVSGACTVYFGTRRGHSTAQARTDYWHHHTRAPCAGLSSPGQSLGLLWAHSDHSCVSQQSLWALNHWPALAKSFQEGKGTKLHIWDLVWKLFNVKNDHRTI